MYPLLSEFAGTITSLIGAGEQQVLLDLSTVTYVDSATIGCLMDLYRQAAAAGGTLKLVGRPEARRDDADDDGGPELSRDSCGRAVRPQELREPSHANDQDDDRRRDWCSTATARHHGDAVSAR